MCLLLNTLSDYLFIPLGVKLHNMSLKDIALWSGPWVPLLIHSWPIFPTPSYILSPSHIQLLQSATNGPDFLLYYNLSILLCLPGPLAPSLPVRASVRTEIHIPPPGSLPGPSELDCTFTSDTWCTEWSGCACPFPLGGCKPLTHGQDAAATPVSPLLAMVLSSPSVLVECMSVWVFITSQSIGEGIKWWHAKRTS